jgi:DNA-binding FadR family transcriptional regulator
MRFARIEAKKKSAQVADQILKAIQRGAYRVGDRLPPERELAAQMGVSRTVVREALSALQLMGVIESKTGSGSFIRRTHVGTDASPPHAASLEQEREDFHPAHIWEARRILSGQVAELAAERLTVRALRKLKSILSRMCTLADREDYDDYAEACEAFHLAIAEATGNPVLVQAMSFLFDIAKREWGEQVRRGYYAAAGGDIRQCFELHRAIVEAMEDGEKERVKELLNTLFRDMEENFWQSAEAELHHATR